MLSEVFSVENGRHLRRLTCNSPWRSRPAAKANARLRKVLTSLYDYSRATWEHRNELLHTTESDALAVSIRSATHAEIKHYHSRPHLLRFDDRFWTAVKQHNDDGCGWLKNQRVYLKKRGIHRQQ